MRVLVVLLACLSSLISAQDVQVFRWKREVIDYIGNGFLVPESTTVNHKTRTMLMKSSSLELAKTPYYRADSMHDFNTGVLALKPLGSKYCFVGKVKRSFEDTLEELEQRSAGAKPPTDRRTLITTGTKLKSSGSRMVDRFCRTVELLELEEIFGGDFRPDWIRFPPLYCIWGPVDIFFPIQKPVFGEGDLPPFIAEWEGPYGPSP